MSTTYGNVVPMARGHFEQEWLVALLGQQGRDILSVIWSQLGWSRHA